MQVNIGVAERIVRIIIGFAIVAIALYYQNWWGLVGLEIGLTGLVGWSPVYRLFHFSTNLTKKHQHSYV